MGWQAMAEVLERSTSSGSRRLVLLALASHMSDGGECWPSEATLALEANVDRRTAQRALKALVDSGELVRVKAASSRRSAHYRMGAMGRQPAASQGRQSAASGAATATFRGGEVPPESLGKVIESDRARAELSTGQGQGQGQGQSNGTASTSRATAAYVPAPVTRCATCHLLELDCACHG